MDIKQKWDARAEEASKNEPLKGLKMLPNMVGITPKTKRGLRWKSFKWMATRDKGFRVWRYFFKRPFKYSWGYLKALFRKVPFTRDGDFFFYNIPDEATFKSEFSDPNTLLAVGFSYCHKPFECPSKRFTPDCIHDENHPVCQQCFIGKMMHLLPKENIVPIIIPTIHDIGEAMLKLKHEHSNKKILFLITACEMTLTMFAEWGNMVGLKGIGVRLDGRICNTMRAFELSEEGIKPGLTVVTPDTQVRMFNLLGI